VSATCNVACGSGIMIMNSSSGSTLQCGRWLLDDMPLYSPKRLPYCNSTSGFNFDHITAVDRSFCTSLRHFIQIGPPSAEKKWSCRFSRWRISAILDFRGPIIDSLKSPCMTSYRSSIETTQRVRVGVTSTPCTPKSTTVSRKAVYLGQSCSFHTLRTFS